MIEGLTQLDTVLIAGIVWLSGVFVWLIKKFVHSYGENTKVLTKVQATLDNVHNKLDTAALRDLEIVKTLSAIHAKQQPTKFEIVSKDSKISSE